jgi:hypothetical protein
MVLLILVIFAGGDVFFFQVGVHAMLEISHAGIYSAF